MLLLENLIPILLTPKNLTTIEQPKELSAMETEFIGNTISFGNNETINRGISQRVSGGTIYGGLQTTQGNNHQQNMTNAHHLYTPELEQNILEAASRRLKHFYNSII